MPSFSPAVYEQASPPPTPPQAHRDAKCSAALLFLISKVLICTYPITNIIKHLKNMFQSLFCELLVSLFCPFLYWAVGKLEY